MWFKPRHCALAAALLATGVLFPGAPALAADANFNGGSADGSVAVFSTTDKLVPGDTDSKRDVYQRTYDAEVGAYVTREASAGPTGGNDAYDASFQGVSANGREIYFSTQEPLAAADGDKNSIDVYAHDTVTGQTVLVSRASSSCEGASCGNGSAAATFKGASTDGQRVFFETSESLAAADGDEAPDVYVRDLAAEPPTTALVSRADASCVGSCGAGAAAETFVGASGNGSKVFFETTESLSAGDGDSASDIYMRDLEAGTTTLLSTGGVCPGGVEASECRPRFRGASSGGSRVFFTSSEQYSGGVADTDKGTDVYVWEGGAPALVSTGPAGGNAEEEPATFAGATPDGAKVFISTGEALTGEDADGASDVYVRDLAAEPPTTTLVSRPDSSCVVAGCGEGAGSFDATSENGDTVLFQTAESLLPEDTDSLVDIYARHVSAETTELVSAPAASCGGGCGTAATVKFAAASADGESVVFTTAEPLAPADEDGEEDVYLRSLGAGTTTLESKDGICPLPGRNRLRLHLRGGLPGRHARLLPHRGATDGGRRRLRPRRLRARRQPDAPRLGGQLGQPRPLDAGAERDQPGWERRNDDAEGPWPRRRRQLDQDLHDPRLLGRSRGGQRRRA